MTIQHFLSSGAPSRKLVMGMTAYGRTQTLKDPKIHDLRAPATGPGFAGPIANIPGCVKFSLNSINFGLIDYLYQLKRLNLFVNYSRRFGIL